MWPLRRSSSASRINPSTAKAGFLTAMYVVLVPVFGLFLGRKGSAQLWVSMAIAVVGLYLLCMKDGFGSIQSSDGLLLLCAVLFSFQIMAVDHFSPQMDGVRLSLVEFFVVSVESTVAALLFEQPAMAEFVTYAGPILYCGIMSSGVAYTLQILGQRDLNPAVASLIMCLESVFSALGGWLLLHQNLSLREIYRLRAAVCRRGAGAAALGRLMRSKA
ncbi:MAG: DMT family transporter [Faecalibacterium prausnitzii]